MAPSDAVGCPGCGAVDSGRGRRGWCASCRARLLPRSQRWGWATAGAVGVLLLTATVLLGIEADRFLIGWLAVMALLCFLAFKIGRRVAFELLQLHAAHSGKERS